MLTGKRAYLLIIVLLLLGSFANAQTITKKLKHLIKEKVSLDSIHRFLAQQPVSISANVMRTIDAGDLQLIAEYYESRESHSMLLQSDADGIYLAVINQTDNRKIKETLLFQYDSARFIHFLALHDSVYQAVTPADLFKEFQIKRFGRACGFGGASTPEFIMMVSFIKAQDAVSLRKWLQDPDYETKILGATGLLILYRKKDIRLAPNDFFIIGHLERLNIPINYCSGCTQWSPVSSAQLLNMRQIKLYKDL